MRGPLNTSLPLLSTCSLQLGSSMMADWGHGRYMAATWGQYDREVSTSIDWGKTLSGYCAVCAIIAGF
jgi:hypothetical protein